MSKAAVVLFCCSNNFGMVVFMTLYILVTHGLIGTITFKEIMIQLIVVFVIASIVELIIVGPLVRYVFATFVRDRRVTGSLS